MNKKAELFVSILTLVSVVVILIPSAYSLTLGAALIESRFMKEDKNRGKKTIELSLTDQTKMLIKNKIDTIEDMSQDDFDNLMTTINNLRNMSHA